MGTQVNSYMTPADERDFVSFIRSGRNLGIFMAVQNSQRVDPPKCQPIGWRPPLESRLSAGGFGSAAFKAVLQRASTKSDLPPDGIL
jgi:hypothetical protein